MLHGRNRCDHSGEYPGWTRKQYAIRATELARAPVDDTIVGYKAKHPTGEWYIVRYDTAANDFVQAYVDGPVTMFKPESKMDYFLKKMCDEGGVTHD